MNYPNLPELCQGEFNDFLLELIRKELRNIPADAHCRRKELCEAFLACNTDCGQRSQLRERLALQLKTWCARKDQIQAIERLGFRVIKGKTHYKVRADNSNYCLTLAATPGDKRTGLNAVQSASQMFF